MLMLNHLHSRFFDPTRYSGVTVTNDQMTVLLWNLSGQAVGWQTYTPSQPKKEVGDPRLQKYFSWVTKPCASKNSELAVFGLETVNWSDNVLFLTEGIFDASRLHWHGLPAVACLTSNPVHLMEWLFALPQSKVACVQGDAAGQKLAKYGNEQVWLPAGKDVSDLETSEFATFFARWL
jgi:hypothetical protein